MTNEEYVQRYVQFLGKVTNHLFSDVKSTSTYLLVRMYIETDAKKIGLAQNFAINKKSTFSCQSLWNLVKMTSSWVGEVAGISAWLDKNCGFFTNSQILCQSNFFLHQSLEWKSTIAITSFQPDSLGLLQIRKTDYIWWCDCQLKCKRIFKSHRSKMN